MKIYNEIILSWNEDTQQFDTLYEDSYDYDGPVDYAQPDGTCCDITVKTACIDCPDCWWSEHTNACYGLGG